MNIVFHVVQIWISTLSSVQISQVTAATVLHCLVRPWLDLQRQQMYNARVLFLPIDQFAREHISPNIPEWQSAKPPPAESKPLEEVQTTFAPVVLWKTERGCHPNLLTPRVANILSTSLSLLSFTVLYYDDRLVYHASYQHFTSSFARFTRNQE